MTVLILVMSAQKDPWGSLMNAQMETWDKDEHPQTRTMYYCGKGGQTSSKVFCSPSLDESLGNVSARTIEAFEESLDLEWDYMARVNSSCYVHKNNLVKFCHFQPRHKVIRGIMTEGEKPYIWGGCHYIFSRDVVEKMVANKDKWDTSVMEDSSITFILQELGYHLTSSGWAASINLQPEGNYLCMLYGHGESFTLRDFADINKAEGHFFFRVKYDPDRSVDIRLMHELKKHLP